MATQERGEERMQGDDEIEEPSDIEETIGLRLGRKVPFSQDYSKEIHIAQEIVDILQARFAANPNLNFYKIRHFIEIMR